MESQAVSQGSQHRKTGEGSDGRFRSFYLETEEILLYHWYHLAGEKFADDGFANNTINRLHLRGFFHQLAILVKNLGEDKVLDRGIGAW
jgi:hypothetical protein